MRHPLRLGIIGLGFGAKVQLPAFLSIPDADVIALVDSGSGRAKQVAAGAGIPLWFNDWKRAVDTDDIDAISVVTPPGIQAEVVCAAIAAGKHVLCEKPFGKNLADAKVMLNLAQHSQLVHAVDFEFRMEPGIAELKRQIDDGTIGPVRRIDVTWLTSGRSDPSLPWSWQHDAAQDGGVLDGYGSHVVDYLQWICQSSIVGVFARAKILVGRRKDINGLERKVTAEDSCDLLCDLANGAMANLRLSNCYPFACGHRIEIYGGQGRLLYTHKMPFTPGCAEVSIETDSKGLRPVQLEPLPSVKDLDTRISLFRKLACCFVEAAAGHVVQDLPSFANGLRVRRVLDAARESLEGRGYVPTTEV